MTDPTPSPSDIPNPALDATDPAPAAPATPPAAGDPAPAPAAPVAGDPAPEPKGDWPENWRELKAKGDEKMLKRLQRYASPSAAIDALFDAQSRVSKGELLPTLRENATAEDIADYRTAHGIPETPAGYDLTLPNGMVIGEADKAMVDEFLSRAHESNMHPSQVQESLGWYFDKQEQARVAQDARDLESRMAVTEELRSEYGPDMKRIMKNGLDLLPTEIRDQFLSSRLPTGVLAGNDPNVIRWLVGLSAQLNPLATVAPGAGTNAAQAVESEVSSLKKMMGDRSKSSEYWYGPNAAKNQARYRDLTDALSKRN